MQKRALTSLIAGLTVGVVSVTGCGASLPQPKFERFDRAVTPAATDYPDVPSVVLLDRGSLILTVDPESKRPIGRLRRYRRIKLLNEAGLAQAKLEVPYNPGEVIVGLIARTTLENGDTAYADSDDAQKRDHESGRPAMVLLAPSARPGAVIDYTYDLYLKDLRFIEPWSFQSALPTKRSEFSVVTPPGFNIDLRYSKDGAFKNRPPERFETPEGIRFFWSESDLPARFPERNSPDASLLAPRAHVIFMSARLRDGTTIPGFDSWDTVGAWFDKRVENWATLSPETLAEAKRVAGETSPEEQALKLAMIVARDLKPDPIGHVPLWRARLAHPDQVLKAQVANATSRGLLLVALLRAVGISAVPGLVAFRDRDVLLPDVPTVQGLDGVVAVMPRPSGPLVLDPNQLVISADVPSPRIQGTRLIALRGDIAEVMKVPFSAPSDSLTELNYTLRVDARGDIFGDVQARFTGAEAGALRSLLFLAKPESYAKIVSDFVRARGAQLAVESVSIADLRALRRPLAIKGSINAPGVIKGEGEELFIQLGAIIGAKEKPRREVRRAPLLLPAPHQVELKATLTLPEDWETSVILDPLTEAWSGGKVELSMRKETRRRLGFRRNSTHRAMSVPPEQYSAYRRFASNVRIAEDQVFSVKRPPPKTLEY